MDSYFKLQKLYTERHATQNDGCTALERSSKNVDLNLFYGHQTSHLVHSRSNRQQCTVHLKKDFQALLGNKFLITCTSYSAGNLHDL